MRSICPLTMPTSKTPREIGGVCTSNMADAVAPVFDENFQRWGASRERWFRKPGQLVK
jgi:hypothetical protein